MLTNIETERVRKGLTQEQMEKLERSIQAFEE